MISDIATAFDRAGLDLLLVRLPETTICAISETLRARWHCQRVDVVGQPLMKAGTGRLSARQVPSAQDSGAEQCVEVCFAPSLATQFTAEFQVHNITDASGKFMLLLGREPAGSAENQPVNDTRLNLALRSGGYALWDHDFETGETYNSPEMLAMFGGAAAKDQLSFTRFNELLHPDDAANTIERKIAAAAPGTDFFQARYRVKTPTGKYAWIESLAALSRNDEGKPKKCVGLCRNIDQEMLTLERLKNSELMLKRTQAISRIGSFRLRLESNVSRLTAELATMIGLGDAMVHPNLATFIKMIEPGDREKFTDAMDLAMKGEHVKDLQIAVKTASGAIEWFSVTMEAERNHNGAVENIFGACQLVTERRMLEDKFHQAQKMEAVGQLTGGVAHDFNNLLMVVMGNVQLLEERLSGDAEAMKRLQSAMAAAERGSNLTRRMLAFSRQQPLQNRELDANALLSAMDDMIRHALTAAVGFSFKPEAALWPLRADRTMLETAILNLTLNARDAMAERGGTLVVTTANRSLAAGQATGGEDYPAGDYVEITVTDSGTGIAPENLAKVFQPFFTTKAPEAGSGLGLSMIYGFVKQSGGHINIDSKLGEGTSVKIYLPRYENVAAPRPEPVAAPAPLPRRKKVLIVDDNASVRHVTAAMVEEMGLATLTAANGPEGMALLQKDREIDLLLSDVVMGGGMHGPELAAEASALRPDLKILFMSGFAPEPVLKVDALPEAVQLMHKPFTRGELAKRLTQTLQAGVAA